ncbi:MAG: hypothetical protein C0490_04705 [Marivirga sp.]|nr:hypothetical protein [Marivirga sp.]
MFNQRKSAKGNIIARWVLNTTFLISLFLSSGQPQQSLLFQAFHTELTHAPCDTRRIIAPYRVSREQNDVNQLDSHFAHSSFVHIQGYHSARISTQLRHAGRIVFTVSPIAIYRSFQSLFSKSDEDHFVSLRG